MSLKFAGKIGSGLAGFCTLALLAGCDVPPPDNAIMVTGQPGSPLPRQGLAPEGAREQVAQIFEQRGCRLHMDDYMAALDSLGYDPDIIDITTDQGHSLLIDRAILEATPMLLADTGEFKRRGNTLTSQIGGCA